MQVNRLRRSAFLCYKSHPNLNEVAGKLIVAKVCQVTGKRPQVGNNISHANNKTKRRWLPNLKKRRFWVAKDKLFVTLTVSTKGMRTIDKLGIEAVLEKIADHQS